MILGYENLTKNFDKQVTTISVEYLALWGDVHPYFRLPYPLQYGPYYDFENLIETEQSPSTNNQYTDPFGFSMNYGSDTPQLYPNTELFNPFKRMYCHSIELSQTPEWLPFETVEEQQLSEEEIEYNRNNLYNIADPKRKICRIKCTFTSELPEYQYNIFKMEMANGGNLTYKKKSNGCWFFTFDSNGVPQFERDKNGQPILIPDSANNSEMEFKIPITNLNYTCKFISPFYVDEANEIAQLPLATWFKPFLFINKQGKINAVPFCVDLTGEKNYNYMYMIPSGCVLFDTGNVKPTINKNGVWEVEINLTFKMLNQDWNWDYHTAEQAKNPYNDSPLVYQSQDATNYITYSPDKRFEGSPILAGVREVYSEPTINEFGVTIPGKLERLGLPQRGVDRWGKVFAVNLNPANMEAFMLKMEADLAEFRKSKEKGAVSLEDVNLTIQQAWASANNTAMGKYTTDLEGVSLTQITKYAYTDLNPLVGLNHPSYPNTSESWTTMSLEVAATSSTTTTTV